MKPRRPDFDPDSDSDELPVPRKVAGKAAHKELAAIYRRTDELLARVTCDCCGGCCSLARTRREPYLFPVELERLELALRNAGRSMPPPRPDGGCRLLDASGVRCSVYGDRPLGCRTFFCDRGRNPGANPDDGVRALTARLTRVSDSLDPGAKPRQITELLDELFARESSAGVRS